MSEKERLNEIETHLNRFMAPENKLVLPRDDAEWLVERVQELEKDIKEWEIVNEQWEQINTQIAEQNKRYREALEFYADEETYEPSEVQVGAVTKEGYKILKYKYDPIINTDKGKKARQALERTE